MAIFVNLVLIVKTVLKQLYQPAEKLRVGFELTVEQVAGKSLAEEVGTLPCAEAQAVLLKGSCETLCCICKNLPSQTVWSLLCKAATYLLGPLYGFWATQMALPIDKSYNYIITNHKNIYFLYNK